MTLFENFNTINQTLPHFERHMQLVSDIKLPVCQIVQRIPYEKRCEFIMETNACKTNTLINYYQLLHCTMNTNTDLSYLLGIVILIFLAIWSCAILASVADTCFCPALKTLSRLMHLNDNVAGVTLLALGNAATDLIGVLLSEGDTSSLFATVYGSSMFVACFVGGIIIVKVPFCASPYSLLRDYLFLLLETTWCDYVVKLTHRATISEALLTLLTFVVYIAVILLEQAYVNITKMRFTSTNPILRLQEDEFDEHPSSRIVITYEQHLVHEAENIDKNHELINQFIGSLIPLTRKVWKAQGAFGRFMLLMKAPVTVIQLFLIPIVDSDQKNHGWSKLLNCLQLITLPVAICLKIGQGITVIGVPMYIFMIVITTPLSTYAFTYSRTDTPPKYHNYLSILATFGSIFLIYICAAEVSAILTVFGSIMSRSSQFMACTLNAWGNSVGDVIANITLARQGYYKMGYAACLAAPIYHGYLSMGLSFLYKYMHVEDKDIGEGTIGENCCIFFMIFLIMSIFGAISTNFILRRSFGIFCILFYIMYLLFVFLAETGIVHPLGADHEMELKMDEELLKEIYLN